MKTKLSQTAKVYVTGYYQVFPISNATCAVSSGLADAELGWLHTQTDLLNQTIQESAKPYQFATYVPVDFSGHEVCSNSSWVQSLQASAPFHPTSDGQSAINNAIKQAL